MFHLQSVNLLEGLLPTKETEGFAASKHLERLFVFCLMWSLGALLELEDRDKLEVFMRGHDSQIDVPQTKPGETIFEYMVNANGTVILYVKEHQFDVFMYSLKWASFWVGRHDGPVSTSQQKGFHCGVCVPSLYLHGLHCSWKCLVVCLCISLVLDCQESLPSYPYSSCDRLQPPATLNRINLIERMDGRSFQKPVTYLQNLVSFHRHQILRFC